MLPFADTFWSLPGLWFALIVVLWAGYFVLEGFDFGVGMLLPVVGRDDAERRAVLSTIGPVWDGNEVWLIVAGGATFAAFPEWYATLFSGFYLALFLILLGLIVRGVAIEYRGKLKEARWRARWDRAIVFGSALPAFLWGVAFADIIHGVPIGRDGEFTGGLLDLLHPYALLGGLVSLCLFAFHGAVFLTLRTHGETRLRARRLALALAVPALATLAAFLAWSALDSGSVGTKWTISALLLALVTLLIGAAVLLARRDRDGWAFAATALAIVVAATTLFIDLYPRVLVSSTSSDFSLNVFAASSSHYTLVVMTIVALVCTPIVLLYQSWSYWVFRARLGREEFGEGRNPLDAVAGTWLGKKSGIGKRPTG